MDWLRTAEMLANRIAKNERKLGPWRRREHIHAYRVYDRDIPELPLVVEVFGQELHLGSFAFEDRLSDEESDARLECWSEAAARALGLDPEAAYAKRRRRQKGLAQYEKVAMESHGSEVVEGGLRFGINLSDYLDTGLFLDHRTTRMEVQRSASRQRVLNLFCYTGAFSVHAAGGGAASTTSSDLSRSYLTRAYENFERNGLLGPNHRFVQADVLSWLDGALERGERFDLVVCDPPTFSNSTRTESDFVVQRDHVALLAAVARVVAPGGRIYFSTNFRKFELDAALEPLIGRQEMTPDSIPADFRDRRIHRCWRIEQDLFLREILDKRDREIRAQFRPPERDERRRP